MSGHTVVTVNTFDSWGGILFTVYIFLKEEFLKDIKFPWSRKYWKGVTLKE